MAPDDDPLTAARKRVVALRGSLEGTEDQPLRRVETPISRVLLTDLLALKLKKPVQLPCLDLTTLTARRRFAHGALWSKMLGGGRLAASPIAAMPIWLADFHRDAAVATPANGFGSTENHARVTQNLMVRSTQRRTGAVDPSEADVAVLERLAPADEPLGETERAAAILVDAAQPVPPAALAARWLAATVTTSLSPRPALPGAP